jgi:hypothetical protein
LIALIVLFLLLVLVAVYQIQLADRRGRFPDPPTPSAAP